MSFDGSAIRRRDPMKTAGRVDGGGPFLLLLALLAGGPARAQAQSPPGPAQAPESPGCAALLPAAQAPQIDPTAAPRRRALLVGISGYTKLGGRTGDWPDLPTRCDVEVMRRALVGYYGFAPEQVEIL